MRFPFFLLLMASFSFAIPSLLSLDGFLTDSSGTPLSGSYSFVFSLYTASSGGSSLWSETQTLTVTAGNLNALLGAVTSLDLPFDQDYYLGVKVSTDPEMTPRYRVASSAYAYSASFADTAKSLAQNATALGGLKLGNDFSACTSANAGTFRWTGVNLEFCTGKAWKLIVGLNDGTSQAQAGLSCKTILEEGYSTGDGAYWIDPNGGDTNDAFQVYCDMTTYGGGWTLAFSNKNKAGDYGTGVATFGNPAFSEEYTPAGWTTSKARLSLAHDALMIKWKQGGAEQTVWYSGASASSLVPGRDNTIMTRQAGNGQFYDACSARGTYNAANLYIKMASGDRSAWFTQEANNNLNTAGLMCFSGGHCGTTFGQCSSWDSLDWYGELYIK